MRLILSILCLFMMLTPVFAGQGYRLHSQKNIFVQPGDTLIKLFGSDWERVYQSNDNLNRLSGNPDKIVVGQKITIPSGTYVTELGLQRLHNYQDLENMTAKFDIIKKNVNTFCNAYGLKLPILNDFKVCLISVFINLL